MTLGDAGLETEVGTSMRIHSSPRQLHVRRSKLAVQECASPKMPVPLCRCCDPRRKTAPLDWRHGAYFSLGRGVEIAPGEDLSIFPPQYTLLCTKPSGIVAASRNALHRVCRRFMHKAWKPLLVLDGQGKHEVAVSMVIPLTRNRQIDWW